MRTRKPKVEVECLTVSPFRGEMSRYLSDAFGKGWELAAPPIFVGERQPRGYNAAAVGIHPYFLIVLRKASP